MSSDQWTHVRLRRATKAALDAILDALVSADASDTHASPNVDSPNPLHRGMSIDDVVTHLLAQREAWKARVRSAKQRRRGKG